MMRRTVLAALCAAGAEAHPCDAEVSAACPDRPGDELARCLKNPEEHETPTVLSSECTDFVALNVACNGDIDSNCDDGHFTDETIKCLTEETEDDRLSPQCKSVIAWAVPGKAEEEEEEPDDTATDEIGMSEKDHREKKEWQEKRRAQRADSIERLKMKEADAQKEKERVELETFKRENPEAYADMLKQQEEDKRQAAEVKKRERMIAAAMERKQREALGLSEDEELPVDGEQPKKKKKGKKSKAAGEEGPSTPKGPLMQSNVWGNIGSVVALAIIIGGVMYGLRLARGGGANKSNSARKAAIKAKKTR